MNKPDRRPLSELTDKELEDAFLEAFLNLDSETAMKFVDVLALMQPKGREHDRDAV